MGIHTWVVSQTIFPMLILQSLFSPSIVLLNATTLFLMILSFTTNTKKKTKRHRLTYEKSLENQKHFEELVIAHQDSKEFISAHMLEGNIIMLILIFKDFSKRVLIF